MVLVYLLVIVLFFIGFHICTRYSKHGRSIDRLPGPPALPIVGSLLQAFNSPPEGIWLTVRGYFKDYYPTFRAWRISAADVGICHADDLKTLLLCKKNINKADAYKLVKRGSGNGLVVSGGSLWHQRRKIINQAMTPELLEYYSKSVIKYAEKFVADLGCQSNKDVVLNTPPIFLSFSMRVAMEGILGLNLDKVKPDEVDEYMNGFSEFNKIVGYRFVRPYIKDWMMKFLPVGRREAEAIKVLNKVASKIIEERSCYLKNYESNNFKNDDDLEDKKPCLLVTDVLLKAEKNGLIDRRGMLDETSTFLIAALETSGSEMCYILALLAENKKAQNLIRAEIREILGDGEDRITINNVKKMEYLARCIKESLRLLPAIPHISRRITEDLELNNYTIPSGTELHMSIYDLHRDPNFWSDPDIFDPDRFLPENIQRRHRFSYLPFSAGLRNCIGQKLAMMQMKILTANIIHNFIIEPVDLIADLKFELKITLTLDQLRLRFIRIKG